MNFYDRALKTDDPIPGRHGEPFDCSETRICVSVTCTLKQRARWTTAALRRGAPNLEAFILHLLEHESTCHHTTH